MMARFNGMMKNIDATPSLYDVYKIFLNGFEDGSHSTDNTFGIKKVVVSLEKTDRASVILFGFDQIFFAASQQIFICHQKRD